MTHDFSLSNIINTQNNKPTTKHQNEFKSEIFERFLFQTLSKMNVGTRDRVPDFIEVSKPKWNNN